MKHSLISAMLFTVFPFAALAEETNSSIRFLNLDQLTGSLKELTPDQIIWNAPILEKPVPFLLSKVIDISLPAKEPATQVSYEATVYLTNGDSIHGQLASVNDEAVQLDTWFAGRLRFNRLMIREVKVSDRPQLIYRGPNSIEGWQVSGDSSPAWNYQNSSFRSKAAGSIAKDVKLPDECSISFDVTWREALMIKLVFFSDDPNNQQPDTGYEMNINSRSVYLRSCQTQKFLGHTPNAVMLQANEKARIEVRASRKSGKVCLLIDDQLIDVWVDQDVASEKLGSGIHFISQNESPLSLSRIEVGAWDGEIVIPPNLQLFGGGLGFFGNQIQGLEEEPEGSPVEVKKPQAGRMELNNGDSITGEVLSITDGKITVKTPFREVKLPVELLRSIVLKPVDLERCKRENGDVRAWFPDGSSIVFRLESVESENLIGYSQNFGTAHFQRSAFNRIEFNIYDSKMNEIRLEQGW